MVKDRVSADTDRATGPAVFLIKLGGVLNESLATITGEARGMEVFSQRCDTVGDHWEPALCTFWGAGVAHRLSLQDQKLGTFNWLAAFLAHEAGRMPEG